MTIQILRPGRADFALAAASAAVVAYFLLVYRNIMTLTFTLLQPADGAGTPIRITHDKRYDEILQLINRAGLLACASFTSP
jgi:hypothetical protein